MYVVISSNVSPSQIIRADTQMWISSELVTLLLLILFTCNAVIATDQVQTRSHIFLLKYDYSSIENVVSWAYGLMIRFSNRSNVILCLPVGSQHASVYTQGYIAMSVKSNLQL